jgi:single-strand DNA-binding protein
MRVEDTPPATMSVSPLLGWQRSILARSQNVLFAIWAICGDSHGERPQRTHLQRLRCPVRLPDNRELNGFSQESWKNDKGEYETRTEWHRVFAWSNLSKFAKTLQKGQLVTLEGTLRYREVEDDVEGTRFKHRITEVHATSMKRLSKVEAADDPSDGADDE